MIKYANMLQANCTVIVNPEICWRWVLSETFVHQGDGSQLSRSGGLIDMSSPSSNLWNYSQVTLVGHINGCS